MNRYTYTLIYNHQSTFLTSTKDTRSKIKAIHTAKINLEAPIEMNNRSYSTNQQITLTKNLHNILTNYTLLGLRREEVKNAKMVGKP